MAIVSFKNDDTWASLGRCMQRVSQLTPVLQVLCCGSSGTAGVRPASLGEKAEQCVLRQGWKMSILRIFNVK